MKDTKLTRILCLVSRLFVGLVFIFSGFVKGVDPLGTSYKIVDYMTNWTIGPVNFLWATPLATPLSVILVVLEFTVGVMLITNSYRKLTSWILMLMMVFFTCTTLADAITNKVDDCGCFGDAVKLTNWQTFWKNVVLMVPTIFLFLCRNWKRRRHFERETLIALIAIVGMVIFAMWNIKNEPCIDFRPWKVGNEMMPVSQSNLEVKSYLTYRNNETGEVIKFESKKMMDFVAADSTWTSHWTFVDSSVEDPYEIKADGFSMLGPDGDDYAKDIIGDAEYVLIGTIHSLDKVDAEGIRVLQETHEFCTNKGIDFVLLTSALDEEIQAFLYANNLSEMAYYGADATAIKAMMRSTPGLLLMKNAKVMGKWSFRKADEFQQYPFEFDNAADIDE